MEKVLYLNLKRSESLQMLDNPKGCTDNKTDRREACRIGMKWFHESGDNINMFFKI